MNAQTTPSDGDQLPPSERQPAYGMWVLIAGLAAVVAVATVAMLHYKGAQDAVTVLGPVIGVIGTMVGGYFGIRGASLAQQKANEAHAAANKAKKP